MTMVQWCNGDNGANSDDGDSLVLMATMAPMAPMTSMATMATMAIVIESPFAPTDVPLAPLSGAIVANGAK